MQLLNDTNLSKEKGQNAHNKSLPISPNPNVKNLGYNKRTLTQTQQNLVKNPNILFDDDKFGFLTSRSVKSKGSELNDNNPYHLLETASITTKKDKKKA